MAEPGAPLYEVLGDAAASTEGALLALRTALPMAKEDPAVSHGDFEALKAASAAIENVVQVVALVALRVRLEVPRG